MTSRTQARWADLTAQQQYMLQNAVKESSLSRVLSECAPGQDGPDRLPQVPHLAQTVQNLADRGLVELTREPGEPRAGVPADRVRAVLRDPANWWSPEGLRPIALAATEAGRAVYRSREPWLTWLLAGLGQAGFYIVQLAVFFVVMFGVEGGDTSPPPGAEKNAGAVILTFGAVAAAVAAGVGLAAWRARRRTFSVTEFALATIITGVTFALAFTLLAK
jgi:hypothetical protein